MEQSGNNQEIAVRQWWQYAVAALALIVAFFILQSARSRSAGPVTQSQADLASIQAGDSAVKYYFLLQYTREHGYRIQGQGERYLRQALESYTEAARRPIPGALRRSGVLACVLQQTKPCAGLGYFRRLQSPPVLRGRPPQDVRDLQSEARMWTDIYSGTVDPRKVNGYAARIRQLNLGPARWFALQRLYAAAGRSDLARKAVQEGETDAVTSLVPYTLLTILLVLMGLAGVVFIGIFLRNRNRWLARPEAAGTEGAPPPETALAAEAAQIQPRFLFEGFIIYILANVTFAILAGWLLSPYLTGLRAEQRMIYQVALQFAVTTASGAVALAAFYGLVRGWGGRVESIGLTARDLGRNILWGIVGYCALLPLVAAASLIWSALSLRVFRGVQTPVHPVVPMVLAGNTVVFAVVFVLGTVVAPFFEEIFFRGLLYNALRERIGVTAGVIVSAAAFAIVHPFPAGFLPVFAIGCVLALLLQVRRSLVPPMVAHGLNNGVTFLVIYLISVR